MDIQKLSKIAKDINAQRYGHLSNIANLKAAATRNDYVLKACLIGFGNSGLHFLLSQDDCDRANAYLKTIESGNLNSMSDQDWQKIADWVKDKFLSFPDSPKLSDLRK